MQHVLDNYPRDELFQISTMLKKIAHGIVNLQDRQRIAVFLRPDPLQRLFRHWSMCQKTYFHHLTPKIGSGFGGKFHGEIVANLPI